MDRLVSLVVRHTTPLQRALLVVILVATPTALVHTFSDPAHRTALDAHTLRSTLVILPLLYAMHRRSPRC